MGPIAASAGTPTGPPCPTPAPCPLFYRWYGANIERSAGCSVCGERMTLDLGEEDAALLARITALQNENE